MSMIRTKYLKKKVSFSILFILLLITHMVFIPIYKYMNSFISENENTEYSKTPKISANWARLNLTNPEVNNTIYYHNETIPIKGRLYEYLGGGALNNYNVSIYADGILRSKFNDTTKIDGNFSINFTVPYDLAIGQTHKIEVNVTDALGYLEVVLENFLIFNLDPYMNSTLTDWGDEVNNSRYRHNETISIVGRLCEYSNYSVGLNDHNVSLYLNGTLFSQFNDTTQNDGNFTIPFKIPFDLDINQAYKIEVGIGQDPWVNDVFLQNFLIINLDPYMNSTLTDWGDEVNNSRYRHNETISIVGRLCEYSNYSVGLNNNIVSLYLNGTLFSQFNDTTQDDGNFTIPFTIPFNLNINQAHKIEVGIGQGPWVNDVFLQNFLIINLDPYMNLNLTNEEINNSFHYRNETIPIKGRLYEYSNSSVGLNNHIISLYLNGTLFSQFNDTTQNDGTFTINFTIPSNFIINQTYKIEVNINQGVWINDVVLENYFVINIVPYIRVNLTNYRLDNSQHYHNEVISINGRLYEYLNDAIGVTGIFVSLFINGQLETQFNSITGSNGTFQIDYTIPSHFSFNQPYKIEVNITQDHWINEVVLQNSFLIYIVPLAKLNLTNNEINNSQYSLGSTISIEGRLFEYLDDTTGISGILVSLYIDGQIKPQFTGTTNINGVFQINYEIPFDFNVFKAYKIEANVSQDIPMQEVVVQNFFIYYTNVTSRINVTYQDSLLKIPGEIFRVDGYLRYDNLTGEGIPNAQINYYWYNSTYNWASNSFFTGADGSFSQLLQIPSNVYSQKISLNMSFLGTYLYIGYSEVIITDIVLFSNITCLWNTALKASEGEILNITGQILYNNSLKISNRTFIIRYGGQNIDTVDTDINGVFTYTYEIPDGTGDKSIQIELVNTASLQLDSYTNINITARVPYTPGGVGEIPPFFMFSIVFFPILAGVIAVLAVFGYRFYKKQEKQSRVVHLPLESKLINLKILKDSGRLEESLSYLFNSVFMDLIEARYNRIKKGNETIRDFAIISVKELKLTPSAIYPFIQTIEKIIYGKPFQITEKDFYSTCELFSPIYFQLTGNNFVLNF